MSPTPVATVNQAEPTLSKIELRITSQQAMPMRFAGQIWIADAAGSLYWPKQKLLIVSDCHFEKGSFLKQFANPIPIYDTLTTISHIAELILMYEPQHVVCLGDSFHDTAAGERMLEQDIESLQSLLQQVSRWTWILGNHDPDIPWQFGGERCVSLVIEQIMLAHEPEALATLQAHHAKAQVIGHFHPKLSITRKRHAMHGKCFMWDDTTLIMPGIGAFTGGLDATEPVLDNIVKKDSRKYALSYQKKIYTL
jgi:DNA ligase-associated metallophosphoesterase